MTTIEERAQDLQRVEQKRVQLEQAIARRHEAEQEEGALRMELTRLDVEKYRLLNGKN